jgi:colanic acid/amylovoran biosynthesis glycosyltransferase
MKILFCTNTFESVLHGPSKFANYLLEINKRYPDTEICILTEDISPDALKRYGKTVFRLDLTLHFYTKFWGFVYRMFPYYQACRNLQSEFHFDIVVFNNAITGIWSALHLKIPVVGMINDDNSMTATWSNFDGSRKGLRHVVFHYCEKLACVLEDGIIINSHFLHALILKVYKPDAGKIHLLHKGLHIRKSQLRPLLDTQTPIKVLFVKADFVRGGLFDLIEALGLLGNYQFHLQVAGPGLIFKEMILQRNNALHVKIDFIGPASPAMVDNLMDQSHFFIVPSHQEAFGVANMEALLHGITVITTDVGGIPEVMDQGNNGWMIEPKNPSFLAKTIQYALENPGERRTRQRAGYHYVHRHFSHEKVLDHFLDIIKQYRP